MLRVRLLLIAGALGIGIALNVTLVPQLMSPRPPVFNGADIAENWEWRSMAIEMHGWWLWEQFPEAQARNVGFTTPPGRPSALPVGMEFEQWSDEFLTTSLDTSTAPLDVSQLGIRDELLAYSKVYSRIHCRSGQEMVDRDTCYYFVAWSEDRLPEGPPTFIGVRTNSETDEEEMALIEEGLLNSVSPVPVDDLLVIDEKPAN